MTRVMKPEVKKLFVEALRNPAYKKGKRWLRSKYDTFCVLGVLCNVHAQQHPDIAKTQLDIHSYLGSSCFVPNIVVEWAFEDSHCNIYRTLNTNMGIRNPIYLNDDTDMTFAEIADLIEAQW